MRPAPPTVRRALLSDHEQATTTLSNAFGEDPIMSWMVGPERNVAQRLRHLFGQMLGSQLQHAGHLVDLTSDGQAVGLWHEVDKWKPSTVETLKAAPAAIRTFGRRTPNAIQLLTKMEKVHPPEPHRHLAFLGVHASMQGRGLGGALLASMNDECDQQGLAAYLESSNPRNVALYARFGFEERGLIALPTGAPPMMAMWRDPR